MFLDANSGNVTLNSNAVCRSVNCTGYTGTLTHPGSTDLTIGDGTAGASNIALKLVTGMTYTMGNEASSRISLQSTSATQQTVDFGEKTTGDLYIGSSAKSPNIKLISAHTIGSGATVTLSKGIFDTNGQTCSWGAFYSNNSNVRTLTLGASAITITGTNGWNFGATTSNLTFTAGTSSITLTGSNATIGTGAQTFNTVVANGSGAFTTLGVLTCANYTRTGTAAKTDTLTLGGNVTVTGTYTVNGNSATNRVLVQSNTVGTNRTITAATVAVTNADFMDITGAGAGSWDLSAITGGSGDCGGNSGITFTTPATQTATMSVNKNWSDATIWTSRVPLPQDDVSLASVTGGTLTADMPRLGRSIDWTGATGSPTWALNSVDNTIYGSLTLITGMTVSSNKSVTFAGRSNYTITSAGKTCGVNVIIAAPGGAYALQDALTASGSLTISTGSFTTNNHTVTALTTVISGTGVRSVTLGTSTIISTSTVNNAIVWNAATVTNLTFSGANATIQVSGATANTRQFQGGGLTYGTLTYTVANSTGSLNVTGSNSFAAIVASDTGNIRDIKFTAATTTTIRNANGFPSGNATYKTRVDSITAANHTLTSTQQQSADYLDIAHSVVDVSPKWYAGINSTDKGTNTNWLFTAPPAIGGGGVDSPGIRNLQSLQNLMAL